MQLTRKLLALYVGAMLFAHSPFATAVAGVSYLPSLANFPDSSNGIDGVGQEVSYGPTTLSFANGSSVLAGRANDLTGVLGVDSAINVSSGATSASSTTELRYADIDAGISGAVQLQGPGNAPVAVSFTLDFDGYHGNLTNADFYFEGYIAARGSWLDGGSFPSLYTFVAFYSDGSGVLVLSDTRLNYTAPDGSQVSVDDPRGSSNVLSALSSPVQGALHARPTLTVQLTPGAIVDLEVSLSASIGLSDVFSPGSGSVHGMNTGVLSVSLPSGYSLAGQDGFLSSSVSVVPEPTTGALLCLGVLVVLAAAKRKHLNPFLTKT